MPRATPHAQPPPDASAFVAAPFGAGVLPPLPVGAAALPPKPPKPLPLLAPEPPVPAAPLEPAVDPDRRQPELLCRHMIVEQALGDVEDPFARQPIRSNATSKLCGFGL